MEDFSRRMLVARVVCAAGPAAAVVTPLVTAPTLVAASAPESGGGLVETTGSLLIGVLIGGLSSVGIAYVLAGFATRSSTAGRRASDVRPWADG